MLFTAFMCVPVVVSVPVTLAALGLLVLAGRLTDQLLTRSGSGVCTRRRA
ncbi:hypothetical protein [Pseudonocardia sp. TRM90224]|nr:hypothetical protein [Pseudonocardia sp. TRM90224]